MINLFLSEIWIYPIKSLGGIRLGTARVLGKGLQFDRRWMLIDETGDAMTQRKYPRMALFKVTIKTDHMAINLHHDQKEVDYIQVDTDVPQSERFITADVWGDKVKVVETDPQASQWFSRHLSTTCRLVAFPEENVRPVDPDYAVSEDQVSLADAFPFLLISQASLDDLNERLPAPVPMNRFRPNFVVSGGEPYQEDRWNELMIGNLPFKGVKRSARCVLTTVNQERGIKGDEPLRTLTSYRKQGNKVYFGQNLITHREGEVNEGDLIIPS